MTEQEIISDASTQKKWSPRGWVLSQFARLEIESGGVESPRSCTIFFNKPGNCNDHPRITEYVSLPEVEGLIAEANNAGFARGVQATHAAMARAGRKDGATWLAARFPDFLKFMHELPDDPNRPTWAGKGSK